MTKLLIVDDEPILLRILSRMFNTISMFEITTGTVMPEDTEHFDAFLLDGTADGVAKWVSTRIVDTNVFIMSGYPYSYFCRQFDVNVEKKRFFIKPFDMFQVAIAIQQAIQEDKKNGTRTD